MSQYNNTQSAYAKKMEESEESFNLDVDMQEPMIQSINVEVPKFQNYEKQKIDRMSFLNQIMDKAQELKDDQEKNVVWRDDDAISSSYHSTPDQSIAETEMFHKRVNIEDATFTRVNKLEDMMMEVQYKTYEVPKSPGSRHCSIDDSTDIEVPDYEESINSAVVIQKNLRRMYITKRKQIIMQTIKHDI